MRQALRSGVVVAAMVSMAAAAQSVEMQVEDEDGVQAGVRMDVQVPAAQPEMNVRVKVKQRTTTTTTIVQEQPASTVIVQPAPAVAVAPVARDCGTGQDPGCTMLRDGQSPMDGETFRGFLEALRANSNELTRQELCEATLAGNYLTAVQLGRVLDLFRNELTRLDVAKLAAPRTVNPGHALGHAAKFKNGLLGKDYTEVMAGQR